MQVKVISSTPPHREKGNKMEDPLKGAVWWSLEDQYSVLSFLPTTGEAPTVTECVLCSLRMVPSLCLDSYGPHNYYIPGSTCILTSIVCVLKK